VVDLLQGRFPSSCGISSEFYSSPMSYSISRIALYLSRFWIKYN
jgi:hypothetical protein